MSTSQLLKISFLIIFFLIPSQAMGKTLTWEEKKWEVDMALGMETHDPYIRNSFSPSRLAQSTLFGTKLENSNQKIDQKTLSDLTLISDEINQETQEAKLVIKNGLAIDFNPGQNGQMLDLYELATQLHSTGSAIKLPVVVKEPEIKLSDTNDLGIRELVAVGESDFSGSPRNRIININVGASKFNGLIINPGQEFSFNSFLGDVDAEHGFLPELVIKKTGTVPEFGGGLCQVSSTAFRAAMNAGFPITARRNHSYAVKYYAPQGTDATIYPGVQDMKFINDLSSHLLIWTRIEGNKLYYDFYGTKDSRTVSFDGPYQYEKQANGAMKAVWTRWVEQNGEKKEQVFYSNYQPPALFHLETQASTPNPQDPDDPPTGPTPTPTETPSKPLTQ